HQLPHCRPPPLPPSVVPPLRRSVLPPPSVLPSFRPSASAFRSQLSALPSFRLPPQMSDPACSVGSMTSPADQLPIPLPTPRRVKKSFSMTISPCSIGRLPE